MGVRCLIRNRFRLFGELHAFIPDGNAPYFFRYTFMEDWDLSYYLPGKKDKIYKATKPGFNKAFSDSKKEIKLYLNEQEIGFRNDQDLKELLLFCIGFTNS